MTDLQEAIRDRLMVATISREWANGPLHIAALAQDPNFELAENRYNRRTNQLIKRMNWPRLFCLAFHGANAALDNEEDRRALALAVFEKVSPRARQKPVPKWRTFEVAAWMATRVHPLACPGPCPLHKEMAALVEDIRANKDVRLILNPELEELLGSCPSYKGSPRAPVNRASPPAHPSVVACRFLLMSMGLRSQDAVLLGDSARESARTEAKVRGLKGAVEICLEVAKRLGL
jgi:hypothetical protein